MPHPRATNGTADGAEYFWGPVTATLDWCEVRGSVATGRPQRSLTDSHLLLLPLPHPLVFCTRSGHAAMQENYTTVSFVAEWYNTISNLAIILPFVFGAIHVWRWVVVWCCAVCDSAALASPQGVLPGLTCAPRCP